MFGWNVFLAFIPYLISLYFEKIKEKKVLFYFSIIVFILFLPNAFYLITDFIHLQNHKYYETIYVYTRSLDIWVALIHIALGFILGIIFGTYSLINLEKIVQKKYQQLIIIFICLLSGIGIYIGRFLRFNSWDIIKPITLIKKLITSIDVFSLGFILLISASIYLFYLVFG
ncbi:MAG TPA: DUF1361 domain-containing protein, partial [Acholeplasmataceae bacterium]|nr:DUF1361 domain-containing protein [Acholeplasmataceae bacterium]